MFKTYQSFFQNCKIQLTTDFIIFSSVFMDIIEETGPLTGYGMFQITRSLLTNMISTSITYLIVLVQFKMAYV